MLVRLHFNDSISFFFFLSGEVFPFYFAKSTTFTSVENKIFFKHISELIYLGFQDVFL